MHRKHNYPILPRDISVDFALLSSLDRLHLKLKHNFIPECKLGVVCVLVGVDKGRSGLGVWCTRKLRLLVMIIVLLC